MGVRRRDWLRGIALQSEMVRFDRERMSALVPAPYGVGDLDRAPESAYEAFYRYAVAHLSTHPPAPLRSVSSEDRMDMIHEVVMHCCREDFRVLRRFDPARSFSAWFGFVARNHIIDILRHGRGDVSAHVVPEDDSQIESMRSPQASPERETESRDLMEKVEQVLRKMDDKCQILLLGAAEGRAPRQMLELLGWSESMNKKASDDLRACRNQLCRRLRENGLQVTDFVDDLRRR
jgi:RNA polymerase sigma factor (sigma-70 family)